MRLFLVIHLDTCLEFPGADVIFVEIVVVHRYEIAVCIGVVVPAAAVIYYIIDAANLIFAAYAQAYCIVLTIFGCGEVDGAEHGCVESARSTESIDAEGVVAAVLRCPFFVVDDAGRNGLAVEVGHAVGTYHHSAVLLMEGIDKFLYGILVSIGIVGVKLDSKLTAFGVMKSYVPVAADSMPGLILLDEDDAFVVYKLLDYVYRTVF